MLRRSCFFLRRFASDHSQQSSRLTGLLAPERFRRKEDKDHVENLLKNLSDLDAEKKVKPEENCWHYGKAEQDWEDLCNPGNYQSPINVDPGHTYKGNEVLEVSFYPLQTRYVPQTKTGRFTTKTFIVQGNFGTLTINPLLDPVPRQFDSLQFHFHAPAEHLINGDRHDLEMHIVHSERGRPNNMAVVGFFFKNDGVTNPFIEQVMHSLDKPTLMDLDMLIPKEKMGVYLYEGSLTTPPLTQGILWFLVSNLHSISKKQLEFFRSQWERNPEFAEGRGNNREVQPLNRRKILYFD
ncbi:unnamed protein product [Blepharisma stoltei]|uniref:carbonic anhydrase n=1 Tax=Blepharisma stoltei TaxID=1481888 RepID=A0AAU9I9T7_9CILI|nr:unnamed protein product [Blepharisma stoltei]